ncbi:MAG: PAS domain-containing protein, partial [Bdellovibrionota bacterium]
AELRKTESDLREAVDIAQVGFWTLDVATNRITVTPILLKQFGINIETFKGTLEEAVAAMHPDDRQTVVDLIELAVYKGKEYHTEYRVIHPDGSIHWVEAKGVTTYDNKESPIKFTGTTLDITDRKTAEEAIQRATKKAFAERTKFEEVLAQAAIPIALFEGADHRFTMANPNFIESFGTLGSPVGKTITEVFPDAVEQGFRSLLDAVYKTGQTFTGKEVPFNRTAGIWPARNFFLDFAYIAKRNAENQIEGVLVVAVDVTESVTAKRALEENALELKTLADSMPQIVWGARPDGTLDYFNQVWFDYSGSTRKENEGMGWTKFVHEDDLPSTVANWTQSLKTEQMYENEFRLRSGTGEYRWHFARAVPVRDLNGSIIKWYGTNTDIHDQVVLRKDLSDAKFVAEKANAAKSQFLANMSHEIRTPLGAIMGFASILRDQTYSKTETDGFVSVIERNSNQLLRIIDDILDLSKVEAGMVQIEHIDFSLPEMLSDFSSLLGFKAREKGISFSFRAVTPLPKLINSDPTRIRQILMNVVGNAIKFTDKGSVEVRVAYEDGFLDFDVEDSGTGITPEQELNLFQPFSQADTSITRKFGGTGLGLVLTRSLAEALGGYFVLKSSTAGKGSTFSVRVKVQVEANAEFVKGLGFESTPPTPAAPIGQLAGLKVLVVEDSPDNQALLSIFLARSGARTDIATDGRQGVNAALGGDYDVVLMDVQMPVLDGINAVKELRQRGYKGPVVALTAHAMKEERIRCLQAGYNEFLSKPVTRDDLVALLSRYL